MFRHVLKQSILLTTLLSFSVIGAVEDSQSFMGVGITDGTKYYAPLEFEPIFRLGVIFDEQHRVVANYSHGFSSGVTSIHLAYDYLYPLSETRRWQAFAGGSVGYKFGLYDVNDWTFGGQAGIRYQINDTMSADFGYRVFDTLDEWKEHELGQLGNIYISIDFEM